MQRDDAPINAPRLLLTGEHPCPYRDGQLSRNIVLEPGSVRGKSDHTAFSSIGFRRSGDFLYRPHCASCSACIPIRLPVRDFDWRRRHRRCWQRNADLSITLGGCEFDPEAFSLYQRYQSRRHQDGPMADGDEADFMGFIRSDWAETQMAYFRLDGRLVAVAVQDGLEDGLSAVYTFFEPDLAHRSLGQFAILWQIQTLIEARQPFLYLGYWIQDSAKMAYKSEYQPAEIMVGGRWQALRKMPGGVD